MEESADIISEKRKLKVDKDALGQTTDGEQIKKKN